jgi:hypothetical protein
MADFESLAAMIDQMRAETVSHQGSLASQMDSNQEGTVVRLETKMDSVASRTEVNQAKKQRPFEGR